MQWFPLAICMILFRHAVGLLWTSDQLITKDSTYTGQHRNTKTNIHTPSGIWTADPSNQAAKTYALGLATIGIGAFELSRLIYNISIKLHVNERIQLAKYK
jgi:hypothetical protein